jgi:hypothetical protein
MKHRISIRRPEEPRTWTEQYFEAWARKVDAAFQMDLDPAKVEVIEHEWAMTEALGPGRISLKRYKAILRAVNDGVYSEAYMRDQEERLDEAFPRDAARDRVHEWEGIWLWD